MQQSEIKPDDINSSPSSAGARTSQHGDHEEGTAVIHGDDASSHAAPPPPDFEEREEKEAETQIEMDSPICPDEEQEELNGVVEVAEEAVLPPNVVDEEAEEMEVPDEEEAEEQPPISSSVSYQQQLGNSTNLQMHMDTIDQLGLESASTHLLTLFANYAQNSLALHQRRLYWIVPERSVVQEEDARGMLAYLRGGDTDINNGSGSGSSSAAALLPPQIKHAMLVYDDTESGFEWDDNDSDGDKGHHRPLTHHQNSHRPKKWLRQWLPRDRYMDLAHRDTSILYRGQHSSPPIRTLPVPSNRPPPEIVRDLAINGTYYQRLLFLTHMDWPSSRNTILLQQDMSILEIEAEFVGGMLEYTELLEYDELAYQSLVSFRRAILNNVHSKSKALREKFIPGDVVLDATPVVGSSSSGVIRAENGGGSRQTSAGKSSRPGSGRMEELLKIRSKKHTDKDNQRRIDEEEQLHNTRISALKSRSIPLHADSIGFAKSGPNATSSTTNNAAVATSRGLLPPLPTNNNPANNNTKKKAPPPPGWEPGAGCNAHYPPSSYVSLKHAQQHHVGAADAEKWVSAVSKPSPGTELTFSPVKTTSPTTTKKGVSGGGRAGGTFVTSIESKYAGGPLSSSSPLPPITTVVPSSTGKTETVDTTAHATSNTTASSPKAVVIGKHTQKRIDEIMALPPPPPSHVGVVGLPLLRPHSGAISQKTVRINDYDTYLNALQQQQQQQKHKGGNTTTATSGNNNEHTATTGPVVEVEQEEDEDTSVSPFPLNVIQLRKKEHLLFIAKKNGIIGNMVDTQGKISADETLRILNNNEATDNDGNDDGVSNKVEIRNLPSIWGPLPPDHVPTLAERKNILIASPLRVGDRNLNPIYATTKVHNHLPSSSSPKRILDYGMESDFVGSNASGVVNASSSSPVVVKKNITTTSSSSAAPPSISDPSSPISVYHPVINPTATIDHIDYSPHVHHSPTRDPYTTLKALQLGELRCRGTLRSLYNDSVLTHLNKHFTELNRSVKILKRQEDQQKADEKCRAFMELEESRIRENVAVFEYETRNGLFKDVLIPKNIRRAQKLIGTHFTKVSQPLLGQYSLWLWGDVMSSFHFGTDVQIPEEAERRRLTRWFKSEQSRIIADVDSSEVARVEAERELLTRDQDLTKPPIAEEYAASSALLQEQHQNALQRRQEAYDSLLREIASIESREHNRREVVEHEFQYSLYTGIGASYLLQQEELVARDHILRTLYMRDFVEQFMTGFTLKQLALTSVEERIRGDISERQESSEHDALKRQLQLFHDRHYIELEAMEVMKSERDALSAGVMAGVWNTRIQKHNTIQAATTNTTAKRVDEMARAKARAAEMERKGLVELRDTGAIRKYSIYASPKSSPPKKIPFSSASFAEAQATAATANAALSGNNEGDDECESQHESSLQPTATAALTTASAKHPPPRATKPSTSTSIHTEEEAEWNRLITYHERFIQQLDIAGVNREGKAVLPSGMRKLERQRVANGERWGY